MFAILLGFALGVAACGKNQQEQGSASNPQSETVSEPEESGQLAQTPSADGEESAQNDTSDTGSAGGKTLVVYDSASGNTKEVANEIDAVTDGDLFEIVPEEIYTDADLDWTDEDSRVSREHEYEEEQSGHG